MSLKGQCLCGAVTIRVAVHDRDVSACHCRICLAWTGVPFLAFDAPPEAVEVTGNVTVYPSSSFAERAFCPVCGSHLWLRNISPEGEPYEFLPGLFPAADGFRLVREVYADRAPRWARFAGDHARVLAAEYEQSHPFVVEGDMT